MGKEIGVYTKKEHLKRKSMSINRQKMKKLISGEADTLIHRAVDDKGDVIHVYKGQELKNLLAAAVMNGRSLPNERGMLEVEYFLAPFLDPNGVAKKICDNDTSSMETLDTSDVPF